MILVTVGTTLPFDALIEEIDRLKGQGSIDDEVLCQIGNGQYQPQHCEFFRFRPSLDALVDQARLVIGHGGTGTTLGLLRAGKRFIAVANPLAADAHQEQFLAKLTQFAPILWTAHLPDLRALVEMANSREATRLELPSLAPHLKAFVSKGLRKPPSQG